MQRPRAPQQRKPMTIDAFLRRTAITSAIFTAPLIRRRNDGKVIGLLAAIRDHPRFRQRHERPAGRFCRANRQARLRTKSEPAHDRTDRRPRRTHGGKDAVDKMEKIIEARPGKGTADRAALNQTEELKAGYDKNLDNACRRSPTMAFDSRAGGRPRTRSSPIRGDAHPPSSSSPPCRSGPAQAHCLDEIDARLRKVSPDAGVERSCRRAGAERSGVARQLAISACAARTSPPEVASCVSAAKRAHRLGISRRLRGLGRLRLSPPYTCFTSRRAVRLRRSAWHSAG